MSAPTRSRLHLIGPWPLRPWPIFLLSSVFFIGLNAGRAFTENPTWTVGVTIRTLAPNIASAALLAAVLWMWGRLATSWVSRLPGYLVAVLITSFAVAAVRVEFGLVPLVQARSWAGLLVFGGLRTTVMVLVVLAVFGFGSERLERQVRRAEEAVERAREQQVLLLTADEDVRQQIAHMLHDRVQGGLFAACMELQQITRELGTNAAALQTVIDRLEELRSLDVRRAAHALSPQLDQVDLATALSDLLLYYEPALHSTIHVDPVIDDGVTVALEVKLGAYRIVEQAALNSAIHGRATTCLVSVTADASGGVHVTVTDDGSGMSDEASPGLGSVLITTWVRALGGSWSWSSRPHGGTVLEAQLGGPH